MKVCVKISINNYNNRSRPGPGAFFMPKTLPSHDMPGAFPALYICFFIRELNLLPINVDHLRDSEDKVDDQLCQFKELATLSSDEVGNKTRPDNNYNPENQNHNQSDANLNLETTQPNLPT